MRNIHMDKNPVKQSAKIIVANAKAKLTKLKNNQPHPTTEIKIETEPYRVCRRLFYLS